MQALGYFSPVRGISGNGLCWLFKRSGSDEQTNKRDKELHLWISSDLLSLADEDKQSDALFCVLEEDERGSLDHRLCLETRSSTPCCPPKDTIQPLTVTSSDLRVIHVSQEASRMKLIFNPKDISSLITMNLNLPTHITRHLHDILMTLCYDDYTSARLLNNIPITQTTKTLLEHSITSMDLKNSQIQWALGLSPEDEQNGNVLMVNIKCNQSPVKSCQSNNKAGQEPWENRNRNVRRRRRKSVSFNEDVVVFLFDEKSPTLKLQTECCTFPSGSSSYNLPVFTMEDNGLEWEDEFATLERNDHLQRFKPAPPCNVSLPTPAFTAVTEPQQHCQTQRCLFLTYVTESDLDL
ncbi:class A basic helix-loop-helix protein 15 isoform X1 [Gouania willdenowi]|uniref:class A basic helix-loop-helix protein 15 isoform X1 n=1 Tax=Gouania willdenowi TaxID=441366 RepID=UPI001054AC00|nr:class A basic helix-loop-helix protein 15 isoform X1 [Gouania willdenowi]XP_028332952.1 class A basic helix-loop-helix protein 15 isoform X1 [Gouania willdenowi]